MLWVEPAATGPAPKFARGMISVLPNVNATRLQWKIDGSSLPAKRAYASASYHDRPPTGSSPRPSGWLPPSQVAAVLHAGLSNHYFHGAYYPRGGGQAISDLLADEIEDGRFADEWDAERDAGHPELARLRDELAGELVKAVEDDLRSRLG